jgi:hypothetical protein
MKQFSYAIAVAISLGSVGIFASAGTAAADGLDATPMPPAVIDANGTHEAPDTGSLDELLNNALEHCWQSGMSAGCHHSRITSSWPGG